MKHTRVIRLQNLGIFRSTTFRFGPPTPWGPPQKSKMGLPSNRCGAQIAQRRNVMRVSVKLDLNPSLNLNFGAIWAENRKTRKLQRYFSYLPQF